MSSIAWMTLLIPIGESEPVSIVRGEPSDRSSILVSPSEDTVRTFYRRRPGFGSYQCRRLDDGNRVEHVA